MAIMLICKSQPMKSQLSGRNDNMMQSKEGTKRHKKQFIYVVSTFQPRKISDQRRKEIHNQAINQQNLEFLYLQENRSLLLVFLGMERHFCNQYRTAQAIRARGKEIEQGVCSSYFGWKRVDNTIEKIKRLEQVINFQNLLGYYYLTGKQKSEGLLAIVSLWLVYDCKEMLMAMKPQLIFRGWIRKSISPKEQYKKKYMEILVGLSSKDMMQKYGMRIAAELISEEIVTGKVYHGQIIYFCSDTELICHLLAVGRSIIQKDCSIQMQEERLMKQS